jgi:hemerythrin
MVNLFSWDDSLSTGVEDVDLQHKKLLLIIDDVRETSELTGTEYSLRMSKDLKRLTDYTLYHFTDEEALMKARGFRASRATRRNTRDSSSESASR